jgi:hypothetical protein
VSLLRRLVLQTTMTAAVTVTTISLNLSMGATATATATATVMTCDVCMATPCICDACEIGCPDPLAEKTGATRFRALPPHLRWGRRARRVHTCATHVAAVTEPDAGTDATGLFVIDTGANGIVMGSGSSHRALSDFQPTTGEHVNSNNHKDVILGTARATGCFRLLDGSSRDVVLFKVLVVPASRWNQTTKQK